jgi:tRNA pseudouridine55 synthase
VKRRGQPVTGWVIFDKPLGLSSAAAVAIVRRYFDAAKGGHGGTLDPLATGVLPIALGEATKTMSMVLDGDKAYRFTLTFGESRNTDDGEGVVTATSPVRPDAAAIQAVIPRFTGPIEQVPPAFSAIKVGGERSYALARAGAAVELAARRVTIYALTLLSVEGDTADFAVECGKGTYIRSLARDLAQALGTVGHMSALRRTKAGRFTETGAFSLDSLEALRHSARLAEALLPLSAVLDDIPALALGDDDAHRLRCGQRIRVSGSTQGIVFVTADGKPVALARIEAGVAESIRVFNL